MAKAVARELATQMAADSPSAYPATAAKNRRVGRIYLDYLRNDRAATAIAPLSPRARAGAPVAMPINWTQVRASLDPSKLTLRSASAALARSKPWADYGAAAASLTTAARKLGI